MEKLDLTASKMHIARLSAQSFGRGPSEEVTELYQLKRAAGLVRYREITTRALNIMTLTYYHVRVQL